MPRSCPDCGCPLQDNAKFCTTCGKPVDHSPPQKPRCACCGAELKETSKFCMMCGKPVVPAARANAASIEQPVPVSLQAQTAPKCAYCGAQMKTTSKFCPKCGKPTVPNTVSDPPAQDENPPLGGAIQASPQAGEVRLDLPEQGGPEGGNELMPPFKALFSGFTDIFSGFRTIAKNPASIITAGLTVVAWIVFLLWNQSDKANAVSRVGSFLTFAEGGAIGSPVQMIGGIFGKGLVVSSLLGVANGGLKNLPNSFRTMFSKGLNIGLMILGLGLAVTLYQLFAGYAGTYGIMTAVSGLLLSLMALGDGGSWLRALAVSFTAKKLNGEWSMNGGKVKSLLTGFAAGFALAALLSPLSYPFWIPLIVAVIGLILSFVLKEKGGAPT